MSLPTPCLNPKADSKRDLRKDVPIVAHLKTAEELFKEYGCTLESGLTAAQVLEQRAKHGYNRLTPPVIVPQWLRFLLQFWNIFALLLLAGGILCWTAFGLDKSDPSNMYLGIVLLTVVAVTSIFGYIQEAKAAKVMDGFKALVPKKSKVVRDGVTQVLDASELVPGDIVHYQEGDQVPADVRVLTATSLKVDNSSLTGESEACDRTPDLQPASAEHGHHGIPAIEAQNLLFFSTIITNGFGSGVVVGTGDNTVMGQIAGLTTQTANKETLIAKDIHRFISVISVLAITLGVVFMTVGIVTGTHSVVQALVFAIGVIVATVPEGLLVTLTVSLALTAKRMHAKSVLVKNTESVETLGSTTLIASDKTGTLTQNRMTVQHAYYDGKLWTVPAYKNSVDMANHYSTSSDADMPHYDKDSPSFQKLIKVATLCNNSEFQVIDPDNPDKPALDVEAACKDAEFNLLNLNCTGDASESGLIKAVQLFNDIQKYRAQWPKLFEIKFNSTNKWQLSIHKDGENPEDTVPYLVLKGAPERVWALCSHITLDGQRVPITKEHEAAFLRGYESLGSLGERVLGFAERTLDSHTLDHPWTDQPEPNFPRDGLTFVGLMALMDPPRDGVKEAVQKCKTASVKVFMVTGDHPITAKAIAMQIGIIDKHMLDIGKAAVVTGDDLRDIQELTDQKEMDAKWDEVLSHEQLVFARVTPAHKLLIVENNQRRNQIVSVTGDGVNDAPALKMANVGVAMGIAGKDVTKEAADIILMDDNFASIVNGVEEGRLIFDNLKKSIMYTLTSKIPELMPFIVFVGGHFPLAITTILILCVDLGTDMVPAISLAYEQREADIMKRPPRNAQRDHLVDWRLLNYSYLHLGVMQCVAGFFAFIMVLNDLGYHPSVLPRTGITWTLNPLICTANANGAAEACGYGCGVPTDALYTARAAAGSAYCTEACNVPTANAWDPFSEFTPNGFRGFAAGDAAVCARSCSWYRSLSPADKTRLAAIPNMLTVQDTALFNFYCINASAPDYGFPGRGMANGGSLAPAGGVHWWAAQPQAYPNMAYQRGALASAQTAYFIAVVLGKMMTVVMSKTRLVSIFKHGMLSNRFLLFAIGFEVALMVLLVYVPPFQVVFGTAFLEGAWWALGVPWVLFLFAYDEVRKLIMRRWPNGFVRRMTYW